MANEMVERVAKAIAQQCFKVWDGAPYAKVMFNLAAKAAIAAMREPTEEMLKHACSLSIL